MMKGISNSLVKFDPTLMITGNQMDPGDENDFAQRQSQDALSRLKLLSAAQFIDHNEVLDADPCIRAA